MAVGLARCGLLALACGVAVAGNLRVGQARCLTPAAGQALETLVAAGALRPVLRNDFTFEGANLSADQITLEIQDQSHNRHGVTLVLPESKRGKPDGSGREFLFYLEAPSPAPPNLQATAALLAIASLFDEAIPETAIVGCSQGQPPSAMLIWPAWINRHIEHETIPRSLALTLALLQLAILAWVLGGAFRPQRMWPARLGSAVSVGSARSLPVGSLAAAQSDRLRAPASAPPHESRVSWIALLVIGVSALVVVHRVGGPSAGVWSDTFNDQAAVQSCLENGACTVYGIGTSVPPFVHAVGWLQLRGLLSALHLSMDRQYLAMQVLDALGVMLAALVAWRLGGPAAAAVATWAIWNRLDVVGVSYYALYNSIPLPCLGAMYLVACVEAVERPRTSTVVAAALVGAILANVHITCITCGLTSVWIGLLAPQRRLRLAAIGGLAFVLGLLAIGPASWLHAAAYIFGHSEAPPRVIVSRPMIVTPLVVDGIAVITVWAVTLLFGRHFGELRRRLDAAIAIVAPSLVAFLIAELIGQINPSEKYIAHLRAPVALALALVVCAPAAAVGRRLVASVTSGATFRRRWFNVLSEAVPYLGAVALLTSQPSSPGTVLRLSDIEIAAGVLRDNLGWDFATALRNLKSPLTPEILSAWKSMYPDWVRRPGSGNDGRAAVLLRVPARDLPDPVPTDWRVVPVSNADVTVLALVPSWIDWTHYKVCRAGGHVGPEQCVDSGLFDRRHDSNTIEIDAMPGPEHSGHQKEILRLRFPLRAAGTGEVHEVFMPRSPNQMCSGLISAVPEGGRIYQEGRRATLVPAPSGVATPELVVEWNLGACLSGYSGFPPFFVEGDAQAVRPLADLMMKSWER